MSHVSELWGASLVIVPIFTILFGVSIRSLFLGLTEYGECSFEPLLPQGLVAFGLIGSICSIVALILIVVSFFKVDDSGNHLWYLLYAIAALGVYGISAILLASVIAYVLYIKHSISQSENPNDPESFCHASVYNFCHGFAATVIALVLITFLWLVRIFFKKMCKCFGKKRSMQS